jgi:hypothetical protein
MSTSPEDRLVNLLSRWLARHVSDDALRSGIAEIGTTGLEPGQREAVDELVEALDGAGGGKLDVAVRETLEALALGG